MTPPTNDQNTMLMMRLLHRVAAGSQRHRLGLLRKPWALSIADMFQIRKDLARRVFLLPRWIFSHLLHKQFNAAARA